MDPELFESVTGMLDEMESNEVWPEGVINILRKVTTMMEETIVDDDDMTEESIYITQQFMTLI